MDMEKTRAHRALAVTLLFERKIRAHASANGRVGQRGDRNHAPPTAEHALLAGRRAICPPGHHRHKYTDHIFQMGANGLAIIAIMSIREKVIRIFFLA